MKYIYRNSFIKKLVFTTIFLFFSLLSFGFQDCSDPLNPDPDLPECDPDIYVPIDNGVYVIITICVLMSFYFYSKKRLKAH